MLAVLSCLTSFAQLRKTYDIDLTDWATLEADGAWGTAYATHTVTEGPVTVTFNKANHQETTITECPVTKGEPVTVSLAEGVHFMSATIELVQWNTKAQTVTLNVSFDGETFYACENKSSDFQPFSVGFDKGDGIVAVKYTFSSQKNQVGIKAIHVMTDEPNEIVPAEEPEVVVTPAAGEVTSLKDFTFTYDGSFFCPSGWEGADLVLMNMQGATVATITQDDLQMSIGEEDLDDYGMPFQCRFSIPEVTTPGKYILHIPFAAFYASDEVLETAESYIEYVVVAPPAAILVDPAPGVVSSLEDFVFTCDQLYICPSSQDGADLTITDADNNVVATITQDHLNMMIDEDCLDESGWNVIASKAHLDAAITEPGTYTLNIPESAFYVGETFEPSAETHFTYTIEAAPAFEGEIEMRDEVAHISELCTFPMEFVNAQTVAVTNFGLLGCIFDTDGEIYALAMCDAYSCTAGWCYTEGNEADVKFVPMEKLKGTYVYCVAQKQLGGFQPAEGEVTVYFCPKSFKVDGKVYDEAIVHYCTITGGQTTGIAGMTIEADAPVYDLQGRRVAAPAKGQLYIQQGQKVIK